MKINWKKYRLADFYYREEGKKRYKQFPGTIINEYYQKTSRPKNRKVLIEIVGKMQEDRQIKKPSTDCCIIHLRTGDIINNSEFSVDQLMSEKRYFQRNRKNGKYIKANWNQYVKTKQYYLLVAEKLKKINIKKVLFLYNLDFNPFADSETSGRYQCNLNNEKSAKYVEEVKSIFIKNSFKIVEYKCQDVDYDFIYMCSSEIFVPSGGGFSRLIEEIVKSREKTIITGKVNWWKWK